MTGSFGPHKVDEVSNRIPPTSHPSEHHLSAGRTRCHPRDPQIQLRLSRELNGDIRRGPHGFEERRFVAASGLKAEELIPPVPVIQALAEQNSAALVPRTREADHEGEACTNLSRNCTRPDGPASAPIRLEHIRGTNPRRSHPWITHREGEAYKRRSTFETEILSVSNGITFINY